MLPVFSVGSEEEAKMLLTMTCPRNYDNEFVAPELAEEQSIKNLNAFGDRLRAAHAKLSKETCKCR